MFPHSSSFYCDNCSSALEGSRITCMDCFSETRTVDFCSGQECVNSTVTSRGADRKRHVPSHLMFKVHRYLFERDLEGLGSLAKDVLSNARGTLLRLKEEGRPFAGCMNCKAAVSMPCWCCVECFGAWKPANIETSLTLTRPDGKGVHMR